MFDRMISHFAGEGPNARREKRAKNQDAGLNSNYAWHLRRTYSDVYSK